MRGWQYGELRGYPLEFYRYELNVRTGKSWLVFWGGKASRARWVYIQPEDIKPV